MPSFEIPADIFLVFPLINSPKGSSNNNNNNIQMFIQATSRFCSKGLTEVPVC